MSFLRLLAMLVFGLVMPQAAFAITAEKPEFKKVADDVYAFIGKLNDANALVVVTTQGVVVVDTGNSPPETRILQIAEEGRRLTVKPDAGPDIRLRVTSDTDIDGAATDRSQLKVGMKLNALYQVPQGFNAALGFDVMEMLVAP